MPNEIILNNMIIILGIIFIQYWMKNNIMWQIPEFILEWIGIHIERNNRKNNENNNMNKNKMCIFLFIL